MNNISLSDFTIMCTKQEMEKCALPLYFSITLDDIKMLTFSNLMALRFLVT